MIKNKPSGNSQILFVLGIILLVVVFYFVSQLQSTSRALIPLTIIALISGLILESRRLCESWTTVFYNATGSFLFSLLAFLPGKKEVGYIFENHVAIWPYFFIFSYVFVTVIIEKDKVTPRLTEGITLLQSIAFFYWVFDLHLHEINSLFVKILLGVGVLLSLFALFNAFTPFILSETNRLILSIWSCIVMVLFAIDNIIRIFQHEEIEAISSLPIGIYIGLQYFLLGSSSIYMAQNFLMLFGFLPGKGAFFNTRYFREIRELQRDHISRYSDNQVSIFHSFICLLLAGTLFYINYLYQLLPRNLAIWTVFIVLPYFLFLFSPRYKINYR